ncbi:MAG: hypothetical protein JOY92_07100 [Verrucomicrobia bacterium]|nr:hypothetical protein [Verrucomicrobiota bacterium]
MAENASKTGRLAASLSLAVNIARPLIYYLARSGEAKRSAEDVSAFETAWPKPRFVRAMYLMTWVWGLGLVFEAIHRQISKPPEAPGANWMPSLLRGFEHCHPSGQAPFHDVTHQLGIVFQF